jgi:hypothetical protein
LDLEKLSGTFCGIKGERGYRVSANEFTPKPLQIRQSPLSAEPNEQFLMRLGSRVSIPPGGFEETNGRLIHNYESSRAGVDRKFVFLGISCFRESETDRGWGGSAV